MRKGSRHTVAALAKMSRSQKGIKKPGTGIATAIRNQTPEMRIVASESKLGTKHPLWNELGWKEAGSYRQVRLPDHPYTPGKHQNWIDQHRAIAEIVLERCLLPGEEIHHINGDKKDNRPANLYVSSSKSDHKLAHASLERAGYELVKRGFIVFREGRYEVGDRTAYPFTSHSPMEEGV